MIESSEYDNDGIEKTKPNKQTQGGIENEIRDTSSSRAVLNTAYHTTATNAATAAPNTSPPRTPVSLGAPPAVTGVLVVLLITGLGVLGDVA
jgi:hypothetical protein